MSEKPKRDALIEALKLARPIVEADYVSACDHGDSDWEGQSYTALSAIDTALSAHPTPATEQGGETEKVALKLVLEMADSLGADPPGRMGIAHNAYNRARRIAEKHRATLTKSNGDPA